MNDRSTDPLSRQTSARTLAHEAPGLKRLGRCSWRATAGAGGQVIFVERAADLVVLDSTASMDQAAEVLGIIRLVSDKPVGVLIYTSGEAAAIGGAAGIVGRGRAKIIASDRFAPEHVKLRNTAPGLKDLRKIRASRVQGAAIGQPEDPNLGRGYLPPTHRFHQPVFDLSEPGLALDIRKTPTLRGDELSLWLPQEKLLAGATLFPQAPNWPAQMLHGPLPIFSRWQETLEDLQTLAPDVIASVRAKDIIDADVIAALLDSFLTAFRSIDQQITDGLLARTTPAELAHLIRLAPALSETPELTPILESLPWIVTAKCQQATGWFDGNPTSLARLSPRDEARRVIRLAGGAEAILQEAETTDTPQWGLELCDRLILAGELLEDARSLKSACLHILAEAEKDPVRMNYYLACAREIEREGPQP